MHGQYVISKCSWTPVPINSGENCIHQYPEGHMLLPTAGTMVVIVKTSKELIQFSYWSSKLILNLYCFLSQVLESIDGRDGLFCAELVSFKHPHVANPRLQVTHLCNPVNVLKSCLIQ